MQKWLGSASAYDKQVSLLSRVTYEGEKNRRSTRIFRSVVAMTFINGIPEDVVVRNFLPKLRAPLNRRKESTLDQVAMRELVQTLRKCWALSSIWKSTIEDTAEWAAWRLARWEAQQFNAESTGPGYSLVDIDPSHPLYGKSDVVENFKTNLNAFVKSKAIWVHCKRHPPLTPKELAGPLSKLSTAELTNLRNVLTRSIRGIDKESAGQIWVTPTDRLD